MGDIILIDRDGSELQVSDAEAAQLLDRPDRRFRVRTDSDVASRVSQEALDERYGDTVGQIKAGAASVLRGATLGLSDVALGALGQGEALRHLKEANPTISTVGEVGGALATAIPSGGQSILARAPAAGAARLGARIAEVGEGASAITRIARGAAGGFAEGSLYGIGSGVSELALSDDEVSLERAIGTISSHALYGGGIGGAAGSLGKVAEIGLSKAKGAIDAHLASREARTVTDDLAAMDIKQLKAARELEVDALKTGHKAEVDAIEATRVTERQSIADDLAALRRDIKEQKHFLTTKDVDLAAAEGKLSAAELGRINAKAGKQLDNILDNPIGLAKNPAKALDALQRQESAMVKLLDRSDDLLAVFAKDTIPDRVIGGVKMPGLRDGPTRMEALDSVAAALEKNRALQERIAAVSQPHAPVPTSSPRLDAIEAARDALAGGGKQGTLSKLPEQMLQGSAFGMVTGAVSALPIPGAAAVAPLIGAAVSKLITEKVFGRLGAATAEASTRTAKAVSRFLDPAAKATKAATPLATKVLDSVRFAAEPDVSPTKSDLPGLFRKRSDEVKAQTQYMADGTVQMRPSARTAIAERLKPISAASPRMADRLETIAVRRLEFLASKLPRRPDIASMQLGPDLHQFSDMEMRQWARYVAGAEDPTSIIERLADGAVSPEDAEVMRAVYPEMLADLQRQVVEQLPTLRKTLPIQRQIALTILTGVAVNPATDPRILTVLQAQYAVEEGSSGGSQAPRAQPQFGSVSKSLPEPTPAQRRSA